MFQPHTSEHTVYLFSQLPHTFLWQVSSCDVSESRSAARVWCRAWPECDPMCMRLCLVSKPGSALAGIVGQTDPLRSSPCPYCMYTARHMKIDFDRLTICQQQLLVVFMYLCGNFAIIDPADTGKVGGFGTVEAVVESSVVTIGKRDHELPSLLCYL